MYVYRISQVATAGRACPECGAEITDGRFDRAVTNASYIRCRCSKLLFPDSYSFDTVLRPGMQKYEDPEAVRRALWHHATTRPDWKEQMPWGEDRQDSPVADGRLMLHVGTRRAAAERAEHEKAKVGYWLYSLRVADEASIRSGLHEDIECFPEREHTSSRHDYPRDVVTPYINAYESPGSVSLYGRADLFRVVSRRFIRLAPKK